MLELNEQRNEGVYRIYPAPFSQAELNEALRWLEADEPVSYIHHPLFDQMDAREQVFGDEPVESLPPVPIRHLLTAEQEVRLFIQFNYCRWRLSEIRAGRMRSKSLPHDVMRWQQGTKLRRDRLVECNMGLVPMMIQVKRFQPSEFDDMISAGHLTLLNAVNKFDPSRGFRFSTYACRSIERAIGQALASRRRYDERRTPLTGDFADLSVQSDFLSAEPSSEIHRLHAMLGCNGASLTTMERKVLDQRFPAARRLPQSEAMSRIEVAEMIGVTKERIRQVERNALTKLRRAMEVEGVAVA